MRYIRQLWSPHVVLEDLSDFNMGQIMAPKKDLVECSRYTMVSVLISLLRNNNRRTSDRVRGAQGSLMCTRSNSLPVWCDPTEELL